MNRIDSPRISVSAFAAIQSHTPGDIFQTSISRVSALPGQNMPMAGRVSPPTVMPAHPSRAQILEMTQGVQPAVYKASYAKAFSEEYMQNFDTPAEIKSRTDTWQSYFQNKEQTRDVYVTKDADGKVIAYSNVFSRNPERDPITGEQPYNDPYGAFLADSNITNPALVGDLLVHPDARHKGIGQAHLENALKIAQDNGADAVIASIYKDADLSSHNFAKAAGFKAEGVLGYPDPYHPEDSKPVMMDIYVKRSKE